MLEPKDGAEPYIGAVIDTCNQMRDKSLALFHMKDNDPLMEDAISSLRRESKGSKNLRASWVSKWMVSGDKTSTKAHLVSAKFACSEDPESPEFRLQRDESHFYACSDPPARGIVPSSPFVRSRSPQIGSCSRH